MANDVALFISNIKAIIIEGLSHTLILKKRKVPGFPFGSIALQQRQRS